MIPLVLIPGMMCDARVFGPQIEALSMDVPLITIPALGPTSMTTWAEELLGWLPSQFAVAGLSMGGILAMELMRQAPQRVCGVALLDTNPLAEQDVVKTRRARQMATVQAGGLRAVMRDEMKPNYLCDGPDRPRILDLCMEMADALGADVFRRQSLALRDRTDQCDTLRAFPGPSLVLCGRQDVLCPVERHILMHDLLPNSRLYVVENAGHLPTLEAPQETSEVLRQWLMDGDRS